jgi:hypothetical protein
MIKQIWFCLKCGLCGVLEFQNNMDAYAAISEVRKHHIQRSETVLGPKGPCQADPQVIQEEK